MTSIGNFNPYNIFLYARDYSGPGSNETDPSPWNDVNFKLYEQRENSAEIHVSPPQTAEEES